MQHEPLDQHQAPAQSYLAAEEAAGAQLEDDVHNVVQRGADSGAVLPVQAAHPAALALLLTGHRQNMCAAPSSHDAGSDAG